MEPQSDAEKDHSSNKHKSSKFKLPGCYEEAAARASKALTGERPQAPKEFRLLIRQNEDSSFQVGDQISAQEVKRSVYLSKGYLTLFSCLLVINNKNWGGGGESDAFRVMLFNSISRCL